MLIVFDVLISAAKIVAAGCGLSFLIGAMYWPFFPKFRRMSWAEFREVSPGWGQTIAMFVVGIRPAAIVGVLACVAVVHIAAYKTAAEILIEAWP